MPHEPLNIRLPDGRVVDVNHPIYNLTQHVHKTTCAVNATGHGPCTCQPEAKPERKDG